MKKKNGLIELYRFIASVIIMIYHSYHLYNISDYPFRGGYILVEAFFALTGYFTYLHFVDLKSTTLHNTVTEVFKYIKKKFSKFLPYTFIAVFVSLIIRHAIILRDFKFIMIPKAILESMMIIRGDSNVGVLWYLSALLWVLPLFCFSCMFFTRKTMMILSSVGAIIFYGFIKSYDCFVPRMFTRTFAGLLLGVIIYELSQKWKNVNWKSKFSECLSLILLSIPIFLTATNIECNNVIIICFVFGFACTFAKRDSTLWDNKIFSYLGKWSFSLYLVHLNIADFICWVCKNVVSLKTPEQYFAYVILTVIGTLIIEIVVKFMENHSYDYENL